MISASGSGARPADKKQRGECSQRAKSATLLFVLMLVAISS